MRAVACVRVCAARVRAFVCAKAREKFEAITLICLTNSFSSIVALKKEYVNDFQLESCNVHIFVVFNSVLLVSSTGASLRKYIL